ncbi:MAG TPA: hypothetical protein VGF97_00915 [Rhizomicrobium sp.]
MSCSETTLYNGKGETLAVQPLYWHPAGSKAEVIVATESNNVYALDAASGAWAPGWSEPLACAKFKNFAPILNARN